MIPTGPIARTASIIHGAVVGRPAISPNAMVDLGPNCIDPASTLGTSSRASGSATPHAGAKMPGSRTGISIRSESAATTRSRLRPSSTFHWRRGSTGSSGRPRLASSRRENSPILAAWEIIPSSDRLTRPTTATSLSIDRGPLTSVSASRAYERRVSDGRSKTSSSVARSTSFVRSSTGTRVSCGTSRSRTSLRSDSKSATTTSARQKLADAEGGSLSPPSPFRKFRGKPDRNGFVLARGHHSTPLGRSLAERPRHPEHATQPLQVVNEAGCRLVFPFRHGRPTDLRAAARFLDHLDRRTSGPGRAYIRVEAATLSLSRFRSRVQPRPEQARRSRAPAPPLVGPKGR